MPSKGWLLLNISEFEARIEPFGTSSIRPYLLLVIRYLRSGPLPDNEVMLANIVKMSEQEWAEGGRLLLSLFEKGSDGLWHDDDLDREYAKAQARSRQGTKAVERRWKSSSARNRPAGSKAGKSQAAASSARSQAAGSKAGKSQAVASSARNQAGRRKGVAA